VIQTGRCSVNKSEQWVVEQIFLAWHNIFRAEMMNDSAISAIKGRKK